MGGYGMMGPGMMGYGPGYGFKLNAKQRQAFVNIQRQTMQKNWAIMGKMREQMLKLQELYGADTVDPKAVAKVYDRITALHKQMLENSIEAHNQMRKHLTKEQRETWQNMRRGMGWGPGMMYEE
ncbi:MAG TPA: periplasmic heavy metal sensor, partial [Gammaproteobacteria bacterium]|nr:periplasmic heavy metal sensor [Gammaproteobacteria bacterium]